MFFCDECDKKFVTKHNLNRHIQKFHNNDEEDDAANDDTFHEEEDVSLHSVF